MCFVEIPRFRPWHVCFPGLNSLKYDGEFLYFFQSTVILRFNLLIFSALWFQWSVLGDSILNLSLLYRIIDRQSV